MAQAVSRQPLNVEVRVRARVIPRGLMVHKITSGRVFLFRFSVSPVSIFPPWFSIRI
jgi:hypothetical protein